MAIASLRFTALSASSSSRPPLPTLPAWLTALRHRKLSPSERYIRKQVVPGGRRKGAWLGSWTMSTWMSPRDTMSWSKEQRMKEGQQAPDSKIVDYLNYNTIHAAVTMPERRGVYWRLKFGTHTAVLCNQTRPFMDLVTTAISPEQLPLPRIPEVAFIGRSNVGKSTLINYITGQLRKGHTSSVPGSTKELHFWKIGKPATLCLVDMPGYGFAQATEAQRLQWTEFSLQYLRTRRNLKRVFFLIDARRWLRPADREMLSFLDKHDVQWQVVVTKCDLVRKKDLARRLTLLKEELKEFKMQSGSIFPVSAHKQGGMNPLRLHLDKFKLDKEVIVDGIRKKVYDALELKRVQKAAKRQKQRAEKAAKDRQQRCPDAAEAEEVAATALNKWGLPPTKKQVAKTSNLFTLSDAFSTREGRRILDIAIGLYSLDHLRMPSQTKEHSRDPADDLPFSDTAVNSTDSLGSEQQTEPGGFLTGLFDKMDGKGSARRDDDLSLSLGEAQGGVSFDFSGQKEFFQPEKIKVMEFDFTSTGAEQRPHRTTSLFSASDRFSVAQEEKAVSDAAQQAPANFSGKSNEMSFDMRLSSPSQRKFPAAGILQGLQGIGKDGSAPPLPKVALAGNYRSEMKKNADALTLSLANTKEAIAQRADWMARHYQVDDFVAQAEIAAGFRRFSKKPEGRSDLQELTASSTNAAWRSNLIEEDPLTPVSGLKTAISNVGDGFGTALHSGIKKEGEFPKAVGKIVSVRRRRNLNRTRRVISSGTCPHTATGYIQMRNMKNWKDTRGASIRAWQIKGKPLIKQGHKKKGKDITDYVHFKEAREVKSFDEMRKKWKSWARKAQKRGRMDIVSASLPPKFQKTRWDEQDEADAARSAKMSTTANRVGIAKALKTRRHHSHKKQNNKQKRVTMY